jgi:hypothetical protein
MKMGVTICISQHHEGGTVRAILVGGVKEAAKVWLNSQDVEIVPTGFVAPHRRRAVARIEPLLSKHDRRHVIKADSLS